MIFLESEYKKIKNLIGTKIMEVSRESDDKYDDSFTFVFDNGISLDVYKYKFWGI